MAAAGRVVTHPAELPQRGRDAAELVGSLHRQLLVTDPAHSDVMTRRSLRRYFAIREIPLARLRDAATKYGGTINDAYITVMASALGRYHERFGSTVEELRLAM